MLSPLKAMAAAAGLALLTVTQAYAVAYTGSTTGAPTFNRPLTGAPPAGLSAVGTAVPYSAYSFTVGAAGSYQFLSIALGGWDNFTVLYQGSFSAAAALANTRVANDDFLDITSNIGVSGFTSTLATGTTYAYVTTGFSNTSFGSFTNSITGPGAVTQVPEPATYTSMVLGLLAVAAVRHRQRAGTAVS